MIGIVVLWAGLFPVSAGETLFTLQNWSTSAFGAWYIYVTAFYLMTCLMLALSPKTATVRLGKDGEAPEFSRFSWFAMMFSAGIGVGMLTYSTAEPILHFANNPDVIRGLSDAEQANNVRSTFKWAMLHYGLTPWACYATVGLALGYFAYNRDLPLTIRSSLEPLFGQALSGTLGHIVDIVAVLATVLAVSVTIGYGVSQFASGVFNISGTQWLTSTAGKPTLTAQLLALLLIMAISTISAVSGVNKGIKWLSNINMGLSLFLLSFFAAFGALVFAFRAFFFTIWDYFLALPAMSFTVWEDGGLADWQASSTIFYWAWWIAFSPFVGMFLARVSRGRTIREYVLGAIVIPSVMGLTWLALVGGTAIDLELSGLANGAIINADISYQLFQVINLILSPVTAKLISLLVVVLLLTFLVTSADSAILIINTISSAGNSGHEKAIHIVLWGLIVVAVVATLLAAGGLDALRSALILGALPFSLVTALMAISLIKALLLRGREE